MAPDQKNERNDMLVDVQRKSRTKKPSAVSMETRVSFQAIVDGHVEHVGVWIEQTANGIPKMDGDKKPVVDNSGAIVYEVKPDPAGAVKLISDLAEYVLPKLSRSEATVHVESTNLRTLSIDELLALKQQLSVEPIIVEQITEDAPSWLK